MTDERRAGKDLMVEGDAPEVVTVGKFAPAPQQHPKRTLYNKETGEVREIYHVDARDYLRQKDTPWVTSRSDVPKDIDLWIKRNGVKVPIKAKGSAAATTDAAPESNDAAGEPDEPDDSDDGEEDDEDKPADNPNLVTWDDWSAKELKAKAKKLKVRDTKNKDRAKLIKALEKKGVLPSDDKE